MPYYFRVLFLMALLPMLAAGASAEQYPPAVQNLIRSGIAIEKSFEAPGGITGYVVKIQNQYEIVYLTADRKHLLFGNLIDEQGQSLTSVHREAHITKPDYTAYWSELEQTAWVAEGAKNPQNYVYVIADPYCPFCHAFWKASLPYQEVGLQLRWVWVSYLRPDGAAKAAAIMEADDPDKAIKAHETAFRSGGIEALADPRPETLAAIEANGELMRAIGATGTPAVLYRNSEDKVRIIVGMPKLAQLADIFKLPEQPQDDPSLARFR